MAKVYATQVPSRLEGEVWVPKVDLAPAKVYGEIKVIIPPGLNFHAAGQVVPRLKEALRDFCEDEDYLLPMGDPLVMAAASAILGSRHRKFKMLKWDRFEHAYYSYDVEF